MINEPKRSRHVQEPMDVIDPIFKMPIFRTNDIVILYACINSQNYN